MSRDFPEQYEEIRVCHKPARVVEEYDRAFKAEIELGGIHQHVTLSKDFVRDRLE